MSLSRSQCKAVIKNIECIRAAVENKVVQYARRCADHDWVDMRSLDCNPINFDEDYYDFRIKPAPQKVTLTVDELPWNCWVRVSNQIRHNVTQVDVRDQRIRLGSVSYTMAELRAMDAAYSSDGFSWKPFWKEI